MLKKNNRSSTRDHSDTFQWQRLTADFPFVNRWYINRKNIFWEKEREGGGGGKERERVGVGKGESGGWGG